MAGKQKLQYQIIVLGQHYTFLERKGGNIMIRTYYSICLYESVRSTGTVSDVDIECAFI